jgi:hypothetical protein
LSRRVIRTGLRELDDGHTLPPGRVRRGGGGCRRLTTTDPKLGHALDVVLVDATLGDPQSPLRWTCKSTRRVAAALAARHHPVNHTTVGERWKHERPPVDMTVRSQTLFPVPL